MSATTVAALRHSNWRKVSSTDNLQAFEAEYGLAQPHQHSRRLTKAKGMCMLLLAVAIVVGELAVVVAKLVRKPPWAWLQAIRADSYYVYLVPLMVPMAAVGVTANWFSLKLFKHNS